MFEQIISVCGYAPKINYCPRCGSELIFVEFDGRLTCEECELEAYIVEGCNSKEFNDYQGGLKCETNIEVKPPMASGCTGT